MTFCHEYCHDLHPRQIYSSIYSSHKSYLFHMFPVILKIFHQLSGNLPMLETEPVPFESVVSSFAPRPRQKGGTGEATASSSHCKVPNVISYVCIYIYKSFIIHIYIYYIILYYIILYYIIHQNQNM